MRIRPSAALLILAAATMTLLTSCAGSARPGPAHGSASGGAATTTAPTQSPAATPSPAPRPDTGSIGAYTVRQLQLSFVRAASVGPDGRALGDRKLPTAVRIPASARLPGGASGPATGPFPLVVFAPGYRQCPKMYAHLLNAWASAGYVVAAVTFPLTNCHVPAADALEDVQYQPADVSYVIRRLLALTKKPSSSLAGLVNPRKVAVAGHSDGGDTVAAMAGNTCCVDHAVVAAVVLAGAAFPALGGTYFGPGSPPTLFVQGSLDPINQPVESVKLYDADSTGIRYYLNIFGADHLNPYEGNGVQEHLVARVTVAFLDRYLAGQRAAGADLLRHGDVPSVAQIFTGTAGLPLPSPVPVPSGSG